MRRSATWVPLLAITAAILVAAAPAKKPADVTKSTSPSLAPEVESTSPPAVASPDGQTATPVTQPEAAGANATYAIDWYSINGGGTVNASSTNYKMGASIGQSVAGAATSPSYQMGIGFWYGAGSSGACACDCHGDPGGPCDGFTNILDVTQVVNAAFRNYPPMLDPNANCPYETPDVNCSGAPEVLDVVKMVNVAFRNGNPATEFCNPCP